MNKLENIEIDLLPGTFELIRQIVDATVISNMSEPSANVYHTESKETMEELQLAIGKATVNEVLLDAIKLMLEKQKTMMYASSVDH